MFSLYNGPPIPNERLPQSTVHFRLAIVLVVILTIELVVYVTLDPILVPPPPNFFQTTGLKCTVVLYSRYQNRKLSACSLECMWLVGIVTNTPSQLLLSPCPCQPVELVPQANSWHTISCLSTSHHLETAAKNLGNLK